MSESKIPFAKEVPLDSFIRRSTKGRFEIRRLNRTLTKNETERLRLQAQSNHGRLYGLGFNLNSRRLFCSKHVAEVYKAIGIDVGRVQTFKELFHENPTASCLRFWKMWFMGFIPWQRQTITPASQLADPKFISVK